MTQSLTATAAVTINASPDRIWRALTDPTEVKQYLWGTEMVADLRKGGQITYTGVWEGKPYEDKGTVLEIDPPLLLRTTYYSPLSGKPDLPENYSEVTYAVSREGDASRLTVTQGNIENAEGVAKMETNWGGVLESIKKMIEG